MTVFPLKTKLTFPGLRKLLLPLRPNSNSTDTAALKNVIYEPIVLGRAVKLHPLIIVIGVVGGAILFGPAGMLPAVPTITVAKVLVASSARHLTAYGLI
jgi:hypothetical protein